MDDGNNKEGTPCSPHFRVWLCGTFRVERRVGSGYELIRVAEGGGSSYPRLLLKALLCCPGRQARRETLLELLWPDADPEQATQSLNTAVTRLRKMLAPGKGQASVLITDEDSHVYRLAEQSLLCVDADAALLLLGEAERRGRTSPEALSLLEEAQTYLSKGMILQDEEGHWAAGRRATVEQARYRARIWLAEAYERQGMPGQAATTLSQLLEEDPTDEDVLCRLMVLLHRQGMTHQALRVYEQACEVAAREEVELTEATRKLATQIATGDRSYTPKPLTPPFSPTNGQSSAFSLLSQVMTSAILEAVRDLGDQNMERSRRLLFQLFGTSVAAFLGLSQDTESGINVLLNWDQQILFEQQLAALWDIYHTGGTAQADSKLKMLLAYSEKSLRYSHAAELLCMSYQLQGSLYRDMMKYDDAHVFYQQAFEAAKELDDVELMSAALARRGVTLIQQNKATAAIAYLSEAHGLLRDRALPCLTGYIFQALSEAYAIAQQEHESKHHIDAAQQVLSDRGKVPERSHCQANTTSVTAQMGVNAVHLHHYAAAIPLIEQGMENYNPMFVRGRARLKAQQAEAYYGLGDIRACCQSATEAWILARAASSNKTFARLRTLQRNLILSPQKKAPEVVDLNWVMTTL